MRWAGPVAAEAVVLIEVMIGLTELRRLVFFLASIGAIGVLATQCSLRQGHSEPMDDQT